MLHLRKYTNKLNLFYHYRENMKDQKKLLHKCMYAEIPVFVLCGSDSCAIEALKEYYRIAKEKGCSSEFLDDLHLLILDFEHFRQEEAEKIKLPD